MSLLNLLALPDEDINTTTTVVRDWCKQNNLSPHSDYGREAMAEAVRLAVSGEKSPEILADRLASHMRLRQFRGPL